MKSFKQFVKEETMPYAGTKSGVIDIRDAAVRDGLNQQLAGVTAGKFVTPYIAFERVCKALANFHIFPPRTSYLEGDSGAVNFRIDQFGSKMGMTDDGRVVSAPEDPHHLYFEYRQSDCGMFMVFCEVVDQEELEEILDDVEAEMNDDTVEDEREDKLDEEMQPALPEVGSRMTPGSNQPVITTGVTIPDELEGKNRDKMKAKLEKKSIEEDNIPYIADPESSSTADYKPASKLAESIKKRVNEVSAELVGKVNKARLEKPAKTEKADETRGKAVKKAWLASRVGELKKKD